MKRSERFKTARYYCHWCDFHVKGILEGRKHIAGPDHGAVAEVREPDPLRPNWYKDHLDLDLVLGLS